MTNTITLRREWRTLSKAERTLFLNTVLKLMKRDDNNSPSFFDRQAKLYGDNSHAVPEQNIRKGGIIHGSPLFFPWRRYFLFLFEKQLQAIEPSIALPYWSSGVDSQAPELAPVWGSDAFGGNGVGKESRVMDGAFKDWQPLYPMPHGLQRSWSAGEKIAPLESIEVIHAKIVNAQNYNSFRQGIEMAPNGKVHNGIGGDMLTMYSPNDPIFYLCAANFDRIWAKWQHSFPDRIQYNGVMHHNKQQVSLTDVMPYFAESVTVGDVMSVEKLGYKYEELKL
jgi:tyrosinase